MNLGDIRFGLTPDNNLGVLIFVGIPKPTKKSGDSLRNVQLVEIFSLSRLV